MGDANDAFEPAWTTEIEITIEKVLSLIEIFQRLATINQFMIYQCGVCVDGSNFLLTKDVTQLEI